MCVRTDPEEWEYGEDDTSMVPMELKADEANGNPNQ